MSSHYLSDPNDEVRIATVNLLSDFLREMQSIATVQKPRTEDRIRHAREPNTHDDDRRNEERLPDITMTHPERAAFLPEGEHLHDGETGSEMDSKDIGGKYSLLLKIVGFERVIAYIPGQNVKVDHAAIVEILLTQLGDDRKLAP